MARTAEVAQSRQMVQLADVQFSQGTITVGQFKTLLETAQKTGVPVESLLPEGLIPEDRVVASPGHVRVDWRNSQEFIDALYNRGPALTNQLGLVTSGAHIIDEQGNSTKTNSYGNREVKEREYDYPGSGPVAVGGDDFFDGRGLGVVASYGSDDAFRVAHVPVQISSQTGSEAATQSETLTSLRRADVGEGQKLVLTYPNGMKTVIEVPEGTTVHIE